MPTIEERANALVDRSARSLARKLFNHMIDEMDAILSAISRGHSGNSAVAVTKDGRLNTMNREMSPHLRFVNSIGYQIVMGADERPSQDFIDRAKVVQSRIDGRLLEFLLGKDGDAKIVSDFFDTYLGINDAAIRAQEIQDGSAEFKLKLPPPGSKNKIYKQWRSQGDARVRDAHADANGQTVLVGEYFDVDGESLSYPGDPSGSTENIINCRCYEKILVLNEPAARATRRSGESRIQTLRRLGRRV